jgi:uncharacterized protein YgbK (DUF1537 family)
MAVVANPLELIEDRDDPALEAEVREAVAASGRKVVALDDDPTGVQTVHDVAVLADFSELAFTLELSRPSPLFFVLTNSRSLPAPDAARLNREISRNLLAAAKQSGTQFVIASRSDSTLRGHFPVETDAIASEFGDIDGVLICPAFFEGGRYTTDDVHYIRQGDNLMPVAETEFARDATFGYTQSNLKEWVEEKTGGAVLASQVASLSLQGIREHGSEWVADQLNRVQGAQPFIVNATCYRDLHIVVLGLLLAEQADKRFIYRTGASFVRARAGVDARPLLARSELLGRDAPEQVPGVVIVGSHVRRSGEQLEQLLKLDRIAGIEVSVSGVLESDDKNRSIVKTAQRQMNEALASGVTPVVYTSRTLVSSGNQIDVSRAVSAALVEIIQGLEERPGFIIGKGGITSSDIGTKALSARRAVVLGQVRPGVPVWRLGPESRFPGMPYVVFPGNVGAPETLAAIVAELRGDGTN